MVNIAFLIRSLDFGGAERQLILLAKLLHLRGFTVTVITFYPGKQDGELDKTGINRICLYKSGRWSNFRFLWRLYTTLKKINPNYLHGYLDIANILALIIGRMIGSCKVIWGIRASTIELSNYDWLFKLANKIEVFLSNSPDLIIANSFKARDQIIEQGFPEDKIIVIQNGIDTERFKWNLENRINFRTKNNLQEENFVVGTVGRLDPQKDHRTFLEAAKIVCSKVSNSKFFIIGEGKHKIDIQKQIDLLGLSKTVFILSSTNEIEKVYSAFDVFVLTSLGESFPNVIAEAMSCGLPVVATDVGDTRLIVAANGKIVEIHSADKVADAILHIHQNSKSLPNLSGIARIKDHFSTNVMVQKFVDVVISADYR